MEPYRVLLADDEEEIRAGISRKIDWSSLGFALVGEAENGQEALELANRGYVLQNGRMVLEGSSGELLESEIVKKAYLGM